MAKSQQVTDAMFVAAAKALADGVDDTQLGAGQLYPAMVDLRATAATVAAAVAEAAWKEGVSELKEAPESGNWKKYIENKMWWPDGRTLGGDSELEKTEKAGTAEE